MNRYTTAGKLLLLFPKLKKEKADNLITQLLRIGQLEPEEIREREDPGEAWTISEKSYGEFENRILWKREGVRRKQVARNEELLKELKAMMVKLTLMVEKLQTEKAEGDREKKVKAQIKG